jgi:hypothetical protein
MSTSNTPPSPSANQPQYVEEPGNYVFQITLNALQALQRIPVPIDRDSDFVLTGLNGSSTGAYTINFQLPSGRYINSSQMQNANQVSPAANQPTAILAPPLYRAGSSGPMLDLTDTSNASNTLEIVFSGIRRLRTA